MPTFTKNFSFHLCCKQQHHEQGSKHFTSLFPLLKNMKEKQLNSDVCQLLGWIQRQVQIECNSHHEHVGIICKIKWLAPILLHIILATHYLYEIAEKSPQHIEGKTTLSAVITLWVSPTKRQTITIIRNSSDELPWLLTDFISTQLAKHSTTSFWMPDSLADIYTFLCPTPSLKRC